MKFYIHTFGCRVNSAESIALSRQLQKQGFQESEVRKADVVIINTCAVTQKAVREARQFIYGLRRKSPKVKIIATGCAATLWQKKQIKIKGLDLVVDNSDKEFLAKLLTKKLNTTNTAYKYKYLSFVYSKFLSSGRLMVRVQTGCDYFCTFCIVPYLRGRAKSFAPEVVVSYINELENKNKIQETILTGINLGLYGQEWGIEFADLIKEVVTKTRVKRISYGSVYVENITDKFLKLYQNERFSRLSRFFHVPLQSGSEKILSLMRRRYTLAEFTEKISYLSQKVKDAFIATDIIVGFLEETDVDFEHTYEYLKKSPIVRAHIFKFNKRPYTAAFYMAKRMMEPSEKVKKYRARLLQELFRTKLLSFKTKFIGRKDEALLISRVGSEGYLGLLKNGL